MDKRYHKQLRRNFPDYKDMYKNIENEEIIRFAMDMLLPREQKIIALRYGINGRGEHTFEEIGNMFFITPERAGQISRGAEKKIERYLCILFPAERSVVNKLGEIVETPLARRIRI